MGVENKEEIERAQIQLKEERTRYLDLKKQLSESDKNIKRIEGYIAYLTGKPLSEIKSSKSIPDHIEEILRQNRKPMRIKDILFALQRKEASLRHTAEQTVAGALIRYVNQNKRFQRTAPNTYFVLEGGNM